MSEEHRRHPQNVPGAFYVEAGCCTGCMAPHMEAPEMMDYDEDERHCYVRRQPRTNAELYRAIRAVWSSEFGCLRYAGTNPAMLRRLAEADLAYACDATIPSGGGPLLRNHVTFAVEGAAAPTGLPDISRVAGWLVDYIEARNTGYKPYTLTFGQHTNTAIHVTLSWSAEAHEITVAYGEPNTERVLIAHSPMPKVGSQGVSLVLDAWLQQDPRIHAIRWYTAHAWHESARDWQATCV
jgi:hypothetical protein